jgi:hypothetical protein
MSLGDFRSRCSENTCLSNGKPLAGKGLCLRCSHGLALRGFSEHARQASITVDMGVSVSSLSKPTDPAAESRLPLNPEIYQVCTQMTAPRSLP